MRFAYRIFLFSMVLAFSGAFAQDIGLLPKYGQVAKSEVQKAADARFLAGIDDYYKGDRKKAAEDVAARGWLALRQGNPQEAMKRFNQAWLIDAANGAALWGMGTVQAASGKLDESLRLFAEAEPLLGGNIDFAVDQAKAIGFAGARGRDEALLNDAFKRFAGNYGKDPLHTLNLQNWAIILFLTGNYAEAWQKVKLAEATPRRGEMDAGFVAALQGRMPRP